MLDRDEDASFKLIPPWIDRMNGYWIERVVEREWIPVEVALSIKSSALDLVDLAATRLFLYNATLNATTPHEALQKGVRV